ncbi:LANO_0G10748g1_1 [Lachancea nothofagi CBS 11611]|uniref:LANO_0G10748g1_1 n=1 Tax=Lachancea nothofagi CBS 11611 TaxID=1266666 RepID=A0A1G4KJB9_9SACH|nr:LANO_0G10748g1_1 [Lachancea nothofagi CBS 11611]
MSTLKDEPFRIAVLGGTGVGKSSLVSRLTVGMAHEVHYPTRKQSNWLFTFEPSGKLARTIMDEIPHRRRLKQCGKSDKSFFESPQVTPLVLLSPVLFQAFANEWKETRAAAKNNSKSELRCSDPQNGVYHYEDQATRNGYLDQSRTTLTNSNANIMQTHLLKDGETFSNDVHVIPEGYEPPAYRPLVIDIVDTPGFKPDMVVPFLEVSLFRNLDKDVLKGLANEPRRPVSTTSLLVASGASELNGKINGYIFVYSAVPELNHGADPPGYEDSIQEDTQGITTSASHGSSQVSISPISSANSLIDKEPDGGLSLLTTIRNCILDAWSEFRDYQERWSEGKEGDVYSMMYNIKQIWKSQKQRNEKLKQLRSFHTKPNALDWNATSPDSPPPCIIICTHVDDQLASPLLLQRGKDLALQWGCGFVGVDSMDNCNVEVALGSLIRESVEKEKILKGLSKNRSKTR